MPNRVIREGLLDSEKFNKLKDSCQLLFIRLMLIADDYGRGDARPEMIKSKCYPVSGIRPSFVSTMLSELNKVKLILLYNVDNKGYFEIIGFDQRLRQKKEKFPKPTEMLTHDSNVLTHDSRPQACLPESESESESEKKQKVKRARSEDVAMTDKEYSKLIEKVGTEDKAKLVIECFSRKKQMKGYKYKNDYLAILDWGIRAYEEAQQKPEIQPVKPVRNTFQVLPEPEDPEAIHEAAQKAMKDFNGFINKTKMEF